MLRFPTLLETIGEPGFAVSSVLGSDEKARDRYLDLKFETREIRFVCFAKCGNSFSRRPNRKI